MVASFFVGAILYLHRRLGQGLDLSHWLLLSVITGPESGHSVRFELQYRPGLIYQPLVTARHTGAPIL
jgi:hypothetical protein